MSAKAVLVHPYLDRQGLLALLILHAKLEDAVLQSYTARL